MVDLKEITLQKADSEGVRWIYQWMQAGGKDETGSGLGPNATDSDFVGVLISRIVAAEDLRIDQLKDELLGTLYSVLDRIPFTPKQLKWIDEHTDEDFGDGLRQAATINIYKSLLDSADSYLQEEWPQYSSRFSRAGVYALNTVEILRHVKNAQRSKPLPIHKLRYLYKAMGRYSHFHLGTVIAADLWQLIHDGKVQSVENYHEFAVECSAFKGDMMLVFKFHEAQDTGAMQKTWNDNIHALEIRAARAQRTLGSLY